MKFLLAAFEGLAVQRIACGQLVTQVVWTAFYFFFDQQQQVILSREINSILYIYCSVLLDNVSFLKRNAVNESTCSPNKLHVTCSLKFLKIAFIKWCQTGVLSLFGFFWSDDEYLMNIKKPAQLKNPSRSSVMLLSSLWFCTFLLLCLFQALGETFSIHLRSHSQLLQSLCLWLWWSHEHKGRCEAPCFT